MCGRFACGLAPDVVRRLCTYMNNETHEKTEPDWFNLMEQHGRDFKQSWNIAPTMTCLCLISEKHLDSSCDSSRYALCSMRWGLIPSYYQADIEKFSFTMNNCRSETIMEKPTFKTPFRNGQRCVVLAEGFYEWKKDSKREPYFIYASKPLIDDQPNYPEINIDEIEKYIHPDKTDKNQFPLLAMAGLFDINRSDKDNPLYSCTIITVEASPRMQAVHIRMPAILTTQKEIDEWLDYGHYKAQNALSLLKPYDDVSMYRVTPDVGKSGTNNIDYIKPLFDGRVNSNSKSSLPTQTKTLDSFLKQQKPEDLFAKVESPKSKLKTTTLDSYFKTEQQEPQSPKRGRKPDKQQDSPKRVKK